MEFVALSNGVKMPKIGFDVFDFALSEQDMAQIATLDRHQSSFFAHTEPQMVEWFAQMVEMRKKNNDHAKEKKNR